ncbi:hypothetical protein EYR41_001619 [Orbilia oligospora]|uniref:Uncharacterized protein n=1 Tax=Orbilia oligospora TaxID=2813651 RepID=A0A8H2HX84_ORBOL|nr:hypothetical protein EYR41_001619 [Orbilia oligospora]
MRGSKYQFQLVCIVSPLSQIQIECFSLVRPALNLTNPTDLTSLLRVCPKPPKFAVQLVRPNGMCENTRKPLHVANEREEKEKKKERSATRTTFLCREEAQRRGGKSRRHHLGGIACRAGGFGAQDNTGLKLKKLTCVESH